jgi:hypothetical protein
VYVCARVCVLTIPPFPFPTPAHLGQMLSPPPSTSAGLPPSISEIDVDGEFLTETAVKIEILKISGKKKETVSVSTQNIVQQLRDQFEKRKLLDLQLRLEESSQCRECKSF